MIGRIGKFALLFGVIWAALELVIVAASAQCSNGQCSRPPRPVVVRPDTDYRSYTPQQIGRWVGQIRRRNGEWMTNPNRRVPWTLWRSGR